jgi:hypothetical protein
MILFLRKQLHQLSCRISYMNIYTLLKQKHEKRTNSGPVPYLLKMFFFFGIKNVLYLKKNVLCALLMVIAKASLTGYCKRLNSKGISVIIIGVHSNSTSSLLNFPFKIVASMILFIIFFTESLVSSSSS